MLEATLYNLDFWKHASIPFVAAFAEAMPDAPILLTGVIDPTGNAHGPNESVDLDDLHKSCVAQAIALAELGGA